MVVREYLKEFNDVLDEHTTVVKKIENNEPVRKILLDLYRAITNRTVLVRQITDDYMKHYLKPLNPDEAMLIQCLKVIYRDVLYIGTVSSIEFNFIRLTRISSQLDPHKKVNSEEDERNTHLSNIIKWNKGKIDDLYLWDFAIKLRNDIVHFDARGRQTMDSPDIEFPITMRVGEEAQGVLRSFVSITKALENSIFDNIIPIMLQPT